jgi:hypothetical protein
MTTELSTPEITDIQIQRENAAFEMLQRQAKMFSTSTLVPKEFQANMANCAIGINIAKRLGADPFMVLQNIDIIHGRPSFRATFLIAMVNASGRFEPLQFRMTETGKETTKAVTFEVWENQKKVSREIKYTYTPTTCVAYAKDKASGNVIEGPPVSYDMAISEGWVGKAGSKWQTDMRELMIRYRAAAFFARLYAPDITLGMMTAEEAVDVVQEREVTPAKVALFTTKQEPEPLTLTADAPTHLEILTARLNESGLTWEQVAQEAAAGGLFVYLEAPMEEQAPDALADIVSAWGAIVAGIKKGGAK